jgi:hypothetical protein
MSPFLPFDHLAEVIDALGREQTVQPTVSTTVVAHDLPGIIDPS